MDETEADLWGDNDPWVQNADERIEWEMTPHLTAQLIRDGEVMTINAYTDVRLVVEILPRVAMAEGGQKVGVIREIGVGHRPFATEIAFEDRVALHIKSGWTVVRSDIDN